MQAQWSRKGILHHIPESRQTSVKMKMFKFVHLRQSKYSNCNLILYSFQIINTFRAGSIAQMVEHRTVTKYLSGSREINAH